MKSGSKLIPLEQRFWSKVKHGVGCWAWVGAISSNGYGNIKLGRRKDRTYRTVGAHRVAWELANGPIPKGKHVLHKCDNPSCVRPDHLFLGTPKDNMADKVQKGRLVSSPGQKNGMAKLTSKQVVSLRKRRNAGETLKSLSQAFGVTQSTISRIANGRRW